MDASSITEHDRKAIISRLVKVQSESIPFLTREMIRYHDRVNRNSYFSKLPEEQKTAWVRYGLEHIAQIYTRDEHHADTSWEKNLAMSSTGGGYRGVNESISGMIVMSHLLAPIVRAEFASDPVAQSYALSLLARAYDILFSKSLTLYEGYVRNACDDIAASRAKQLEDIKVDGLMVDTAPQTSIDGYRLTNRELEVLHLVGLGFENGEICAKLHMKLDTVKGHVRNLMAKTLLHNRTQLALLAASTGVCTQEEIAESLIASQAQ